MQAEWKDHGINGSTFQCDKGYGYIDKVKGRNSYEMEVSQNGMYKTLGRKQTMWLAKQRIERYFGLAITPTPVKKVKKQAVQVIQPASAPIKYRPLTFCEQIKERVEREKKQQSETLKEYNDKWNMTDAWWSK